MRSRLKAAGIWALALGAIGVVALVGFIIAMAAGHGLAWVGEVVYPWLLRLSFVTMIVTFFILLPLSFIRGTYSFSAAGFVIASYVYGLGLWVWALLLTYYIWGGIGVFIGVVMMGIGVVPVAIVATVVKGMWPLVIQLVVSVGIVIALRAYGAFVSGKAEKVRG